MQKGLLLENARATYEKARKEKHQKIMDEIKKQLEAAGPNPFLDASSVELKSALEYMEECIMYSAHQAENTVVIKYMDIPSVYLRSVIVQPLNLIAKQDLNISTSAIKDAFKKTHPEFDAKSHLDTADIVFFKFDSFKITF
jgi:hypothetical protein